MGAYMCVHHPTSNSRAPVAAATTTAAVSALLSACRLTTSACSDGARNQALGQLSLANLDVLVAEFAPEGDAPIGDVCPGSNPLGVVNPTLCFGRRASTRVGCAPVAHTSANHKNITAVNLGFGPWTPGLRERSGTLLNTEIALGL